jgi:hypothetical protein
MGGAVLDKQTQDKLFELFRTCYWNPKLFFSAVLRTNLRRWQSEVCDQIRFKLSGRNTHNKILIRSCHGSGKTFLSAGILLWFMTTRPGSRGLTLAPTWNGVENLLWPEVERLYAKSLLSQLQFGRVLTTKYEINRSWYAVGASSDHPANLEGHHSESAAIRIIDEAKAVPSDVFDATQGTLDAPETLDLWISTPSLASGDFYDRDMKAGLDVIRKKVTIDELIADGIPGKAEWKAECVEKWGENSFQYQSRCMAEYASDPSGSLYPIEWVERAMDATFEIKEGPAVLGVDPAGSVSGDESAIAIASNEIDGRRQIFSVDSWLEPDTMKTKGRARAAALVDGRTQLPIRVDVIGLGKGLADSLLADGYPTETYRATDAPDNRDQFLNKKAEDSWTLRRALEKGGIRLPRDQKLKSQMTSVRYEINPAGKIKVIDPKDSPDRVDAILVALASQNNGIATSSPDWI